MRASTKRERNLPFMQYLYRGVLRDGNKIVWTCNHQHIRRDRDFHWSGERDSALGCAYRQLHERTPNA